jgi:hypothetical protein
VRASGASLDTHIALALAGGAALLLIGALAMLYL